MAPFGLPTQNKIWRRHWRKQRCTSRTCSIVSEWVEFTCSLTPHSTQYRSFRRRSIDKCEMIAFQPTFFIILCNFYRSRHELKTRVSKALCVIHCGLAQILEEVENGNTGTNCVTVYVQSVPLRGVRLPPATHMLEIAGAIRRLQYQ